MDTKAERWKLLWPVQRSARYHARRQSFFDRWRLLTAGASVLLGSAAATNIVTKGGPELTLAMALAVTVLSTIDLVVGTTVMARLHSDLRRRYLALETDIQCQPEPTKEDLDRWKTERLRIEADEPPVYVALDLLCENEMARAYGMPPRAKLPRFATASANLLRWESIEFEIPKPGGNTAAV
jgi:hypothetical protein